MQKFKKKGKKMFLCLVKLTSLEHSTWFETNALSMASPSSLFPSRFLPITQIKSQKSFFNAGLSASLYPPLSNQYIDWFFLQSLSIMGWKQFWGIETYYLGKETEETNIFSNFINTKPLLGFWAQEGPLILSFITFQQIRTWPFFHHYQLISNP